VIHVISVKSGLAHSDNTQQAEHTAGQILDEIFKPLVGLFLYFKCLGLYSHFHRTEKSCFEQKNMRYKLDLP